MIKTLRLLALFMMLPLAHVDALMSQSLSKERKHHKARFWSKCGLTILGKPIVVHHQEHTQNLSHTLIVCNHQGLVDPLPIMLAMLSPMSFVSKEENKKILGIGAWGKAIDLIYFNRDSLEGNVKMLRECTTQIRAGGNVLIFPEGTRSKSDSMNPFKSKAFGIVKMAKANILPVSLSHAYDPFDTRIKQPMTVTIHPLIKYEEIEGMNVESLSDKIYDIIQNDVQPTTIHS